MNLTRPPSAADRAYHHVKDGIIARRYAGGSLLSEGDLATALAMSRTPVREALLRLEAEGFLALYPKKGALVLPVSAEEISDVLQARELIEAHAVAGALDRRDELIPVLTDLLDAMRRHEQAGDRWAFADADRAFHAAMVARAGNMVLTRFYDSLRDRQLRMGVAVAAFSPARMNRSIQEHEAIVRRLAGGDADALRDAVASHVRHAADELRAGR